MSIAVTSPVVFATSQSALRAPVLTASPSERPRFDFGLGVPVDLGMPLILALSALCVMSSAEVYPAVFTVLMGLPPVCLAGLIFTAINQRLALAPCAPDAQGAPAGPIVYPRPRQSRAMRCVAVTRLPTVGTPVSKVFIPLCAALVICHLISTRAGDWIASVVAERAAEQYLIWALAGLAAASVLYVLIGGGLAQ